MLLVWAPDFAESRKPVVICGPTGCGKSTWAKTHAPKPALWVTHLDILRKFDPKYHKSIIFDELRFAGGDRDKPWPLESQIQLVDSYDHRDIHVRYGCASIPPGIPKIFTCTGSLPFSKDPQIKRRILVLSVYGNTEALWE